MESFDYQDQFNRVKKDVIASVTKALDIQSAGANRKMVVHKVWIDDNKNPADWESQKQAVRKDKTWGVPVYATVDLIDRKTGAVLSSEERIKVATLPRPTNLGSFIIDGKHYQVQSQLRRKPGVYTVQKRNKQLKTEVNIQKRPFDIDMDPETQIFKMKKAGSDQAFALYPILSRLGISDVAMARRWGKDVLEANKSIKPKNAEVSVRKAALFFTGSNFDSAEDAANAIKEYFQDTEIKPEVTKSTLGKAYTKVTPDLLLRGSEELLRANRGEREADDRQALEFKKVLGMSDLMRERMLQSDGQLAGAMSKVRGGISRKINNRKKPVSEISKLIKTNEFTPFFNSFFSQSSLSNITDQTNPITMLNGTAKITVLGEGGVMDATRVRGEERAVHPSQMGFIDPIHTPDSGNIGLVMNLPLGVTKNGENLQTKVIDPITKKIRSITPSEARNMVVAFPDQYSKKTGKFLGDKVRAFVNGQFENVSPDRVDVVLASPKQAFSIASNTIPFLPAAQGVRAQMATKMLEQAIPLSEREAPLVQVGLGRSTIEKSIGEGFSVQALDDGIIEKVEDGKITIKTKDGKVEQKLYTNIPLNKKAFLTSTSTVKEGDAVKKGDVIADSNFTKDGQLALGTNLRAAYIPYKGYNFEDGIVITESAAKKLTSEHMNEFASSIEKGMEVSLKDYMAWKGGGLDLSQRRKLDKDGVIKIGETVHKGDALWVGTRENKYDPDYIAAKKMNPNQDPKKAYREEWTKDGLGEVVDVVKSNGKIKVYVKSKEAAVIGDKLTNRHGGKGIVTKIIPDGEAPYTADGRAVDILLNPHGVVSRINPSQILETAAAKIADLEGKPYVVENFSGENYTESVTKAVKKAGISDTETLYDPHTKKALGDVLVGPQYTLKLSKQATSQFSARSEGKYDADLAPLKGGEDGAKALDMLTFYSMLSHGARSNIREMATYKATENKEFWRWVERGASSGMITPPPEPTLAYKKFEAYMKGAGVNMERRGSKMVLGPMTDEMTDKISNGKVRDATFLRAKDLKYERGGLMDPNIFGQGDKWGHIELAESIPNPVFEKPIKVLTGIDDRTFKAVVKGERFLDPKTNEWNEKKGLTGGEAISHLLKQVDVDKEIAIWTDKAKGAAYKKRKDGTRTEDELNTANKRLRYLHALKKLNMSPDKAYIQKKIPVVPTQFRKIIEMEGGNLSNAGLNSLYRDVGLISDQLKWQKTVDYMPESVKAELRENLYGSVKAVAGLGEQVRRGGSQKADKRPRGIIEQLKGKKAKEGFFQRKVLRRTQNLVGRGTIIPDPKLGVDEVGLPKEMSWTLFEKFVTRRLVNSGYKPNDAIEAVNNRTPAALSALQAEMESRPVMLNRAPSLHKFSIQSFKPRMVDGKAIKIPPLIVGGFNADFDGDAMTVHVPVLSDSVAEAKKMLPSRNLYSPGTGDIMIKPQNEAALGLYQMSIDPKLKGKILEELPEKTRAKFENRPLDKKGLGDLMKSLAIESPDGHGAVVDKLKLMGDDHTYKTGFTVSLKDLSPVLPERNAIFARTKKDLAGIDTKTRKGREEASALISAADKELEAVLASRLDEQGNSFRLMVRSGARGNMQQLKQILSAPFAVPDHRGQVLAEPITTSFAEGLPFSDYWNTLYGARAVATDKQLQTQLPGAFNKDIMASSVTNVISGADCGVNRGVKISLKSKIDDAEDRYLAKDISVGGTVVARAGTLMSTGLLNTLRDRKVDNVEVRSPLTCNKPKGTCAKCFGLNESGNLSQIGDNIGATAGQALSEPLTQMTLRTFHQGGVAGGRGVVSGYDKIDKLFKMPKIKRGKATLAKSDGVIESVKNAPGRTGKNIKISGYRKTHFVENDLWNSNKARVGKNVFKGDILSDGLVQPQELVELKGMQSAQEYLVDEIQDAYGSQGVKLKRKTVETVIRAVANTTKIHDAGDSNFLIGDVAPWTVVEDYNRRSLGKKGLDEIIGLALKEDVPGIRKNTIISEKIRSTLERMGKSEVEVGPRPIGHEPFLKGIEQIPMLRKDWMSQMGYRNIEKAITEGAATLSESDIHGYAPVPAFAYGAEFGLPGGGKEEGSY